ncbi:class I SAM-dependent methyltransferase [Streptomyces sp. P38-E01]|uniref:Class I SAM-dependent methyltransferase n=2 Tax=Streptomyces tardus TaxID=2780544 RepID=A0A949N5E3_9ACTN|nr:class I SAM-dependent methyltransferase [Streptomyces tardus]
MDRALLGAFTESVRSSPAAGPVVDAGCGPGWTTAYLHALGADVLGVDLSPAMIGLARRHHPELSFEVGSMDALDLADGGSAGVLSWYSVIHLPPPLVPSALAEFRRVLADGGVLLLAFFESEGGPVTDFDHAVTRAYRWPIDELAALASDAGFTEVARLLREPVEGERFRRGHLLMRAERPGSGSAGLSVRAAPHRRGTVPTGAGKAQDQAGRAAGPLHEPEAGSGADAS